MFSTLQQIFRSGQPSAMVITVRAKFSKELGILPLIWSQALIHGAFLQESQLQFGESPNSVPLRGLRCLRCQRRTEKMTLQLLQNYSFEQEESINIICTLH